uniref:Uncharacterized protein n=1 Tax=Candidatus Methanogaster sp. ANME-2c ERB4 TaxID=2759911 RepID=A0A7G9YIB1_9EURY|nr:hypothetical protein KOFJCHGD_00010 [Methanosarcinales archaeon ANME-2c ERB4]
MFNSIHKRIFRQMDALRRRFAQTEGLPFSEVLSDETIQNIIDEEVSSYRNRIFSPYSHFMRFFVTGTQFGSLLPKCSSKGACGTSGTRRAALLIKYQIVLQRQIAPAYKYCHAIGA